MSICFQRFLNKAMPSAVPQSSALITHAVLTYDGVSSSICNLCGRPSCVTPADHGNAHTSLTRYDHKYDHHQFNHRDYNETALQSITKYKKMTQTDDVAETFLKIDRILYDLFLFNSLFFFVGYSLFATDFQFASKTLPNCN